MPDLKYRLGKNPAKKVIDHIHPKVVFFNRVPILNKIIGIINTTDEINKGIFIKISIKKVHEIKIK